MYVERVRPGDEQWPASYGDHVSRYLLASKHTAGKRVLDAGCGFGYGSHVLRVEGAAADVQALELDPAVLQQARETYSHRGIRFIEGNCETLAGVERPVDVVCNFENIEHLEHPERFLAAAADLLGDQGLLLCSTPEKSATAPPRAGRPDNPFHVREWTRSEFEQLLRPYFADVHVLVQVRSHAAQRRAAAALVLDATHRYHPVWRTLYGLGRLTGAIKGSWPNMMDLALCDVTDFHFVDPAMAPMLGAAVCNLALCRRPLRGVAAKAPAIPNSPSR